MVSNASLVGLSGKRPPSKSALKASSLSCRAMRSSIGCCWPALSGSFETKGYMVIHGEHLFGFQMSDRLQELSVFVRAAESGSFSKAARELGLSQPSVSRIIGELETRLGVKLLLRTTRRITVTDAGALFLTRAREVLADIEDAEDAARGVDSLRGTLRITMPIVYGTRHIIPRLPKFLAAIRCCASSCPSPTNGTTSLPKAPTSPFASARSTIPALVHGSLRRCRASWSPRRPISPNAAPRRHRPISPRMTASSAPACLAAPPGRSPAMARRPRSMSAAASPPIPVPACSRACWQGLASR